MRKNLLALALLTAVILTGCSYSQTGIEGLLQPPKLSKQQNEIYAAIEAETDNNIKLKYPRKGDFTSAFLINNIDDEPTQEAIVFYEKTNNPAPSMPLRINVLDQKDGKWVSICEIGAPAPEVEKVSFITADKKVYIIIGFNQADKNESPVKIYTVEDGMLTEKFNLWCKDYEIFDINGDGQNEIITMEFRETGSAVSSATASVHCIRSDGLTTIAQAEMDPKVNEYAGIYKGKTGTGEPALYLDCLKGTNNLSTEILTMQDGILVNLIYTEYNDYRLVYQTTRRYGSFANDLNQDGVFEIPKPVPAPGFEFAEEHQKLNFTQWYNYKNESLVLTKTTYVDYQLGYVFSLPEKWIGKVTIEAFINENEVVFYEYNDENPEKNQKLATIKAVKKGEYKELSDLENYNVVKENGQLVYLYQLFKPKTGLVITISDMENNFALVPRLGKH